MDFHVGYPAMAKALNKTGRPIMYSCEWPLYERAKGVKVSLSSVPWSNTSMELTF